MSRIRRLFMLLLATASVSVIDMGSSCASEAAKSNELVKLLHGASSDVGSAFPDIPGQLTFSPAFKDVWNNAKSYRHAARGVLAGKEVAEREKLILAYGMQALCLQDLLELHKAALADWKRGLVSHAVLDRLLFPVYDWNTQIQQNYKRPEVKSLLQEIKRENVYASGSARSRYLEEVISGDASRAIERLRRDGQLLDRRTGCRDQ